MNTSVYPVCSTLCMSPSPSSSLGDGFCFMRKKRTKILQPEKRWAKGDIWNHELLFMEAIMVVNRESLLTIFIYLYLFIIYLSKPRLLTTKCCTNTRLKGSPSPTANNASVSCSVCCWWCKAFFTALSLIWSSSPLLFYSAQIPKWLYEYFVPSR